MPMITCVCPKTPSKPQCPAVQESGENQPARRWLAAGYAPQCSLVSQDLERVMHTAQVIRVPLLVCSEATRFDLGRYALCMLNGGLVGGHHAYVPHQQQHHSNGGWQRHSKCKGLQQREVSMFSAAARNVYSSAMQANRTGHKHTLHQVSPECTRCERASAACALKKAAAASTCLQADVPQHLAVWLFVKGVRRGAGAHPGSSQQQGNSMHPVNSTAR
eukprot:GHRQ01021922.1.p1 GENE.GHRQ01021922.1~~GHRQ01021922.1.p1  ORF type:complete len:218 (-),score=39.96 GHRQ01021922.1:92-745(-)